MKSQRLSRPAIAFLLFSRAFSQTRDVQPARESTETPMIRVTVNLVQVDAVVTDAKGKQVTDLTADDFQLFQDGKPQKITHFSYISTAAPIAPSAPNPPAGRGKSAVTPPPPSMKLRPDQVRRTIAVVVDDLGTSYESMAQIRGMLKKFVDQQMQPGDLVAILRTGAGMGAFQQFTSDKRQLYAAIDRVKYNALGRAGVSAFGPLNEGGADLGPGSARADDFRYEYFAMGTLGAVDFVVRGLKDLPGRKAVILMSDSIRLFDSDGMNDQIVESLRHLTDAANRAAVVIYGIDPRGLPTLSLTAADKVEPGRNPEHLAELTQQRHREYFESQDGLSYLSHETGGLFLHDSNDLSGSMRAVLNDQTGYYLIGYTPSDATFQELKGKGRAYHKLSVKVKGSGLTVRSRTGFFGVPDQDAKPVYATREQQLMAALSSPFGSGAVRLRLTALFANNEKVGSFVQSMLHIDGHDLTFSDEPDGWHKAVIDILLATFGDNGTQMDQTAQTYTVRLRGEAYKAAIENGFVYTINHPVKKPGAYQLRSAVRDAGTEKVGSASQFIEVPDVSKGHLTLSGIVVRASRPAAAPAPPAAQPSPSQAPPSQARPSPPSKEPTEAEVLGSPAMRMFHPGKRLDYALEVLNAQQDQATKKPQLESQMFLFHDGKQIYAGKPKALQPEKASPDSRNVFAAGQLQLGSTMEPGEYAMQIVVTDKLAKDKYKTVAQSIDFEIVK